MEKNHRTKIKSKGYLILALIFTLAITNLKAQEVLTLEKALQYAETGSPDLQKTKLSLLQSQKNLEAQRAALKSKFSLTVNPATYSRSKEFQEYEGKWFTSETFKTNGVFTISQPILFTDGTISLNNDFGWRWNNTQRQYLNTDSLYWITDKKFTNNLNISLEQPLFTYNKTKQTLKTLELSLENSNLNYAMRRLSLEKSVTQLFYSVYMSQKDLDIAKEELANTQKSYDIIKNKVDAGLAAQEELYQAELNLATSKSTLQTSEVQLESDKDDIKLTLGMDLYQDIVVLADIASNPVTVDLDKAIENGLNSRMEIRQKEIAVENGLFSLITVRAQNEFNGSMRLTYGFTGQNEHLGNMYDQPTKSPSVSLQFNIPIFDWGANRAKVAAQEAANQSTEIDFDQQKKQIIIDIRQSYRNLLNQQNQIEIAKQNEKNAQLTYDINLQRYENGDLTGMDLNLYQTQLSEKKIAYSQALINYKIELLNLKIQSLYDFAKNEPVVPSELYLK